MALPKLFQRIFFHNNTTPALNEDNLNAMSKGLSDVDDRLIELAGTIMEDVPEIQHDLEILEPAIENIDANVTRAETAADNAEEDALKSEGYAVGTQDGVEVTSGEYYQNNAKYYAEIANPPIENTVDFTDIITISDAINKAAKDVRLKVEAVQDLHGYDKPWVGGAGKNILPLTIANLKTANTGGTWSGNNYTYNGITFACQVNDDGAVTGIKITGTNGDSATSLGLYFSITTSSNMILSGCPSGGGASNYQLDLNAGVYADQGSGGTVPSGTTLTAWRLRIGANYAAPSEGMWFYPMLRKSTESATFEPYTNICPITGWDNAKVTRVGKNIFNPDSQIVSHNQYGFFEIFDNDVPLVMSLVDKKPSTTLTDIGFGFSYRLTQGGAQAEINTGFTWVYTNNALTGKYTNYDTSHQKYCGQFVFYPKTSDALAAILDKYDIQVEFGTTSTAYEPYQGEEITISLNGTRYGGTLDVTSGVLTLTHAYKEFTSTDSQSWSHSSSSGWESVFYTSWYPNDGNTPTSSGHDDVICSAYEASTINGMSSLGNGKIVHNAQSISSSSGTIAIRDTRFSTAADFKASLTTPLQIVYELATPQTIQLTAEEVYLLYGYNTLFGDCGDISLTYDASGIIHIDEAKLDTETLKTIAAASSDFADFKARIAAL